MSRPPPFEITEIVLAACSSIERRLGRLEGLGDAAPAPRLRRDSEIRTIHGSLAIEGNTLSAAQVTALLDGQRVAGPPRDIREVQNAAAVYQRFASWRPPVARSFLAAHAMLMDGLTDDAGRWRSGNVGIWKGKQVAHMAPPARRVPQLMTDLFAYLRARDAHSPLIKACVFHYEVEFIHPFSDGNGRMGRLWQQVILTAHHPVFRWVPVEELIREHQSDYYAALAASDRAGNSTAFLELSLELLERALEATAAISRPARATSADRLAAAVDEFAGREFTRADYLRLHPQLSAPTASRDLQHGVAKRLLIRRGDRRTARYRARGT